MTGRSNYVVVLMLNLIFDTRNMFRGLPL